VTTSVVFVGVVWLGLIVLVVALNAARSLARRYDVLASALEVAEAELAAIEGIVEDVVQERAELISEIGRLRAEIERLRNRDPRTFRVVK
jgi:chromosome segregation ATPase